MNEFTVFELEKIIRNSEDFEVFYAVAKNQMPREEATDMWNEFWDSLKDEQVENEGMDALTDELL